MQKAPVNGHRSDRARAQTAQNAETTPIPLPELPSPPLTNYRNASYAPTLSKNKNSHPKKNAQHPPQTIPSKATRTIQWLIDNPTQLEQME